MELVYVCQQNKVIKITVIKTNRMKTGLDNEYFKKNTTELHVHFLIFRPNIIHTLQ